MLYPRKAAILYAVRGITLYCSADDFFMRNCIINYEGRYYDTVCSDDVYNSNAEIKEGKGASMTLTDAGF